MTCESATQAEHIVFRTHEDKKKNKNKKRKRDLDDSDGEPGHNFTSTIHFTKLIVNIKDRSRKATPPLAQIHGQNHHSKAPKPPASSSLSHSKVRIIFKTLLYTDVLILCSAFTRPRFLNTYPYFPSTRSPSSRHSTPTRPLHTNTSRRGFLQIQTTCSNPSQYILH